MIPGQLSDPGVNFASVHSLTTVTAHMNFFVASGATLRGGLLVVQHRVTRLAEVKATFHLTISMRG